MTATQSALSAPAAFDGFGPPPQARPARNIAGALLGVLLIVFCGASVAVYTSTVGHRRAVLMMARPVGAGAVIQSADLTDVRVATDPAVHTIAAAARPRIVGRVAGVNLLPGTLLAPGELGAGPQADANHGIVGLALKAGQFPAGIRALDRVTVVDTGPATGPSVDSAAIVVTDAEVTSAAASADGQNTVVSILVPRADGPAVAAASARGQISLILVAGLDGG